MMATRSLPEEVVIEILSWLPAKDLIRSRCVCKAWFRLLTIDLHFHKLHLHRLINYHSKHTPTILLEQLQNYSLHLTATNTTESDEAATMQIQCPFNISPPRKHAIFGVCNGLVCLATPSQQELHNNIYIWNPLTKDYTTIPCPHIPSHFPCGSSITYGFGFCRATTEYKIIRIISWNNLEFHSDVSVYTLGTHSWRTLGSIPYDINILEHHTALVNDAIHWFAEWPGSLVRNVIASFNMKEEIFQEVPHPPSGINYDYPNYVTIGELDGLLCIFWAYSTEYIKIWVMKEYANVDSWTNQFKIGRPEVRGEFYFLRPLGFTDNGEIIIDKNGQKFILYNPRTNSTRRLIKFDCQFYRAFPFIGSIVSPRLVNGVNISPI